MKPDSNKNQKLIKQYPFVSTILNQWMWPLASWYMNANEAKRATDLTIRVEKADGNLMYRRADFVGYDSNSCFLPFEGKHKNQVGRQGEHLFAIDAEGKIINRVAYPRTSEERRISGDVYGWAALWAKSNTAGHYSNPLWKETKYLVWVSIHTWHEDTRSEVSMGCRFGDFVERSVLITIYSAPDCGFEKLQDEASFEENLWLDSKILMNAIFENNREIIAIGGRLDELCRMFQDEVYFDGMKNILDEGEVRGASGQLGSVKVLCAEMCGYDRVMLQDSSSWISFQLRPGQRMMYVLGMGGTLPQLRNLVRSVAKLWHEKHELRNEFKPDRNVSVI